MSYLFGRKYSIGITNNTGVSFDMANNTASYKQSETKYSNLRVVFEITRTLGKTPDKAVFQLYNITEGKWSAVDIAKTAAKITLKLGYNQITPAVVYTGKALTHERVIERTDTIDVFTCGDGHDVLTKTGISRNYESGFNTGTIIEDLIKTVKSEGVELAGDIKKKIAEIKGLLKKQDTGFSVSGLLSSTLETLLKPFNKTITIQDDVLKIVEIGKEEVTGKYTILTPETGLIGSPSKTKDGLEFVALIQPGKFNPGQFVEIKSRDFDGRYKIVKSNFVGDTHGNDWYVRGLCI